MLLLVPATSARADLASMNVTVGADPAESIVTQVGAAGAIGTVSRGTLTVRVRPNDAAGCGTNDGADAGSLVLSRELVDDAPFSEVGTYTFPTAGLYLVCAWIEHNWRDTEVVASAGAIVSVRPPHVSLSIVAPPTALVGAPFAVSTTATSEASRLVRVVAVPNLGRPCEPTFSAATALSGSRTIEYAWKVVGGPLIDTRNVEIYTPGPYVICGYATPNGPDDAPEATAVGAVTVLAPCVVPLLPQHSTLAEVKAALAAAGCAPGRIAYAASTRFAKGTLIRLGREAGGDPLPPRTPIGATISTGRPCVVPKAIGTTLAHTRRALEAAHCTAAKVKRTRSVRYRKGRVIRLSPKPGKHLATGARVRITVSRGR